MNFDDIFSVLQKDVTVDVKKKNQFGCNFILATNKNFKSVIKYLKDCCDFEYLVDVVGVHWPENNTYPFEVIYNLYSIKNRLRIIIKVPIPSEEIETVSDLYKSALFLEREQYDLVGIKFTGHPDLRRILMPEFFDKHPLRKDFKLKDRSWYNDVDEQNLGIKYKHL
jgi:NADH-quinone oxidoreductase subunit C